MPNKYKLEATIIDDYEEMKEDPLDLDDVIDDLKSALTSTSNALQLEGEVKVTKIE